MGGGGGNPIASITNPLEQGLKNLGTNLNVVGENIMRSDIGRLGETALDVGLNVATAGLVGYDQTTGKRRDGLSVQVGKQALRDADETLGEVTGRNLMREQMNQTRRDVDTARENDLRNLMNERRARMEEDRFLSLESEASARRRRTRGAR